MSMGSDIEKWQRLDDGTIVVPYYRNIRRAASEIVAYARLSGRAFWICKLALLPTGVFSKRKYIYLDYVTPSVAVEDLALNMRMAHSSLRL